MKKAGGGALLIAGIFLVLIGALLQSGIVEFLLDIIGFIVIVSGVILGIVGLIKMFWGGESSASDF